MGNTPEGYPSFILKQACIPIGYLETQEKSIYIAVRRRESLPDTRSFGTNMATCLKVSASASFRRVKLFELSP
jgi:hypothetical protein